MVPGRRGYTWPPKALRTSPKGREHSISPCDALFPAPRRTSIAVEARDPAAPPVPVEEATDSAWPRSSGNVVGRASLVRWLRLRSLEPSAFASSQSSLPDQATTDQLPHDPSSVSSEPSRPGLLLPVLTATTAAVSVCLCMSTQDDDIDDFCQTWYIAFLLALVNVRFRSRSEIGRGCDADTPVSIWQIKLPDQASNCRQGQCRWPQADKSPTRHRRSVRIRMTLAAIEPQRHCRPRAP